MFGFCAGMHMQAYKQRKLSKHVKGGVVLCNHNQMKLTTKKLGSIRITRGSNYFARLINPRCMHGVETFCKLNKNLGTKKIGKHIHPLQIKWELGHKEWSVLKSFCHRRKPNQLVYTKRKDY